MTTYSTYSVTENSLTETETLFLVLIMFLIVTGTMFPEKLRTNVVYTLTTMFLM
jgi:hypothetical protein